MMRVRFEVVDGASRLRSGHIEAAARAVSRGGRRVGLAEGAGKGRGLDIVVHPMAAGAPAALDTATPTPSPAATDTRP